MAYVQPNPAVMGAAFQNPTIKAVILGALGGIGANLWLVHDAPLPRYGNLLGGSSGAAEELIKDTAVFVPSPNVPVSGIFGFPDTVSFTRAHFPRALPATPAPPPAALAKGANVLEAFVPQLLVFLGLMAILLVSFAFVMNAVKKERAVAKTQFAYLQAVQDSLVAELASAREALVAATARPRLEFSVPVLTRVETVDPPRRPLSSSSSTQTARAVLRLGEPVSTVDISPVLPAPASSTTGSQTARAVLQLDQPISIVDISPVSPAPASSSNICRTARAVLQMCPSISMVNVSPVLVARAALQMGPISQVDISPAPASSSSTQTARAVLRLGEPISIVDITPVLRAPASSPSSSKQVASVPLQLYLPRLQSWQLHPIEPPPKNGKKRAHYRGQLRDECQDRVVKPDTSSTLLTILPLPYLNPVFAHIAIPRPVPATTPDAEQCVDCHLHYTHENLQNHLGVCRDFFDYAAYCATTKTCFALNKGFRTHHADFCTDEECVAALRAVRPGKKEQEIKILGVPGAPLAPKALSQPAPTSAPKPLPALPSTPTVPQQGRGRGGLAAPWSGSRGGRGRGDSSRGGRGGRGRGQGRGSPNPPSSAPPSQGRGRGGPISTATIIDPCPEVGRGGLGNSKYAS